MKALFIPFLAIMMALMPPGEAFAGKVSLPKDVTKIDVKFDPAARIDSGRLKAGDSVSIYLAEDYKIGGITVIEAGAKGTAIVKKAVKASRPGNPGMIEISFVDLKPKGSYRSKDGGAIKLSGVAADKGGGRKIISWLFILGLLIKGGQGEIDTALVYPATVSETIILESR
ncbi:MAG: hypothetical protein NTW97_05040 [Candidatus Krumholzibacteria bacterium]|nr:hypothetical protein [Candidatus Krumholzibacteria bacterium]